MFFFASGRMRVQQNQIVLDRSHKNELSHEKNPGWLGYIGDYTTQLYRDKNNPL